MGWGKILCLFVLLTLVEYHQCGRYGGYEEYSKVVSILEVDEPKPPPPEAWAYRTTRRAMARPTTGRSTTPRPTTKRMTTPRHTTPRLTTRHTTSRPITRQTTPRHTTPRHTTPRHTTTRHTTRPTPPWVDVRPNPTTPRHTTPRHTTPRHTTPRHTTTRYTTRLTPPWVDVRPHPTTPRYTTPTKRTTTTRYTTPKRTATRKTTPRPTFTTPKVKKIDYYYQNLPPRPGTDIKPGKTKIVIKNTYNYRYPGFYTIPVPDQHPGYYRTYNTYRYTPTDTGDTALGFYLGYKLAKLSTPTFSHQSFYDGYRPRYDHYTVHHYYHNADSVQKQQRLESNAIVGCVGDSRAVCPGGTTSLCTSDGTLMCVVSARHIVDCTDANKNSAKCVKSTVSCENNEAPECKGSTTGSVSVDIPCVSTAQVEGDIKYVNNTILKTTPEDYKNSSTNATVPIFINCTRILSCVNNTSPECVNRTSINVNATCVQSSTRRNGTNCVATMTCANNTLPECVNKSSIVINVTCDLNGTSTWNSSNCFATVPCSNTSDCVNKTISVNATCVQQNLNGTTNCSTNISCLNSTVPECANKTSIVLNATCDINTTINYMNSTMKYLNNPDFNETTTLPPPTTSTSDYSKWKRSVPPQDFCVTVLAVPAVRKPTEGEEFLDDAKSVLTNFLETVWGL